MTESTAPLEPVVTLQDVQAARKPLTKYLERAREHLESLRSQVRAVEVAIGDLDGSLITASETARTNPAKAIAQMSSAAFRFEQEMDAASPVSQRR